MIPRTSLIISSSALLHNYAQVHKLVPIGMQCGIVVKANAYGHGMLLVAQLISHHFPQTWLCVAGTQEALTLRTHGIIAPILVMNYIDTSYEDAVHTDARLVIVDIKSAQELSAIAGKLQKKVKIHLKVDTGMCRRGVLSLELTEIIDIIAALPYLELEGIFTHLSDPNTEDQTFTQQQLAIFEQMVQNAQTIYGKKLVGHVCASGSFTVQKKYDMVRIGTTLYGHWKTAIQKQRYQAVDATISLHHVITWKTSVLEIKSVTAGSFVGYNRTFCAQRSMTLALLPVGYSDGLSRLLSNNGVVRINGKLAPIVGIVSMNITAVDVTDISDVHVGTEVIIMGDYDGIRVADYAQRLNTIPNEITTSIPVTVPRVLI